MKKIFFSLTLINQLFFFALCSLLSGICYSQWQADVRLTNDPASSNTSGNNAWCIASSGNVVHVVWYDNRDGNSEIYYKRSTDGGISWGADTRLTNNSANSLSPSATVSGQVVHVVWHDLRDGNSEIYYKRSTDAGVSWGADTRLTNNTALSNLSCVAVSGQVVHVVWVDFRDGGSSAEIYYKSSTDAGVSWGPDTRLTNDPEYSSYPSVTVSGQVVHVVWRDGRDANYELYYKRSTNGGTTWGADTRLTNNTAASWYPSVTVSGQVVHVVWHDLRDGNSEIYYKRSTDGGTTWGADTRLTNNSANSDIPSVSVSGQVVHIVWRDDRDGNLEIYYKRSTDSGTTWGADTRLTNDPALSLSPSVSVSGQVVNVVWYDLRDGNEEIYYKRDPTGNSVGIITISNEIPDQFKLSQNYPNPFNPVTNILFNIPERSFVKLSLFNTLGQEVSVLVNEEMNSGSYKYELNAENLTSGVYFYRLTAASPEGSGQVYTETKKMVILK